jgi:hypothetical protein
VGAHRGDGATAKGGFLDDGVLRRSSMVDARSLGTRETRGVRGKSQIEEGPSVGVAHHEGGGCGVAWRKSGAGGASPIAGGVQEVKES